MAVNGPRADVTSITTCVTTIQFSYQREGYSASLLGTTKSSENGHACKWL